MELGYSYETIKQGERLRISSETRRMHVKKCYWKQRTITVCTLNFSAMNAIKKLKKMNYQ